MTESPIPGIARRTIRTGTEHLSIPAQAGVFLGRSTWSSVFFFSRHATVSHILDSGERFLKQGEMDVLALEAMVMVQPPRIHKGDIALPVARDDLLRACPPPAWHSRKPEPS
jgi:hypothetical protein